MRLRSADVPHGRRLGLSLIEQRERASVPPADTLSDERAHALALAAEFARARAEGYAAGMDDAMAELEKLKSELDVETRARRDQHDVSLQASRQQLRDALDGLESALVQASTMVGPIALELAITIVDKMIGQRLETGALAQDVLDLVLKVAPVPILELRVGIGVADACTDRGRSCVVDPTLSAYESVIESARGGTRVAPARTLRAIVEPLLLRLEQREGQHVDE